MGTVIEVNARRVVKAHMADREPHAALPPGCRGAACPAFALCQGRCASGGTRVHPDGGVWITPRG